MQTAKYPRARPSVRHLICFLTLAAGIPAAASEPQPATGNAPSPDASLTPAEQGRANELRELVADGKTLLDAFAKAEESRETAIPQADKERRVRELLTRYERLLRDNPDDTEALLLYGKFLRAVGERDLAFKAFLRADRNSPNLAVAKHQMGAHLAENGDFAEALPLLRRAAEIAPQEPRYHYDLAEFLSIAGESLIQNNTLSRAERDTLMLAHFAAAARLKPAEAGFRWRAAEAHHEVAKPDAKAALAEWDAIARDAKSDAEKEVISLHRAKWLILLGRAAEARKLIAASATPALDATRRKLLDLLQTNEPGLKPASR